VTTSLCLFHPDALPGERTLLGRMGCAGCLADPGNLDARGGLDPLDVDGGEARCPQCRTTVRLRATPQAVLVCNPSGPIHRCGSRRATGIRSRDV
jgi:hypothetical protein